jgi:hypothetical protein
MQLIAQQAVIDVFSRLMRIRIATQDGHQRLMTLAILENEFSEALRVHESQVLVDHQLTERGALFRDSFQSLSSGLMHDMAQGLTESEKRQLCP